MLDRADMPVTVLGTGSMGGAIARAFLAAGHPTTVWNRTPGRADALAAAGATRHASVGAALASGPVVVTCLTSFRATRDSLAPATAELPGRTLITLNSGTPAAATEFADWATDHGAHVLAGAIKNVPAAVGHPGTLLCFGGDRTLFDTHTDLLRVLGGDLVHLGPTPDLAALYESAVGATLLPTLLGFLEGAAILRAHDLPAHTLVPFSTAWLEMIASLLPTLAEEIDTRDYTRLGSSIALFHDAIPDDEQLARDSGVDTSHHAPVHALLRRAMAEGRAADSVTALIELLAVPIPD
ncbi:NAD(P)-dependent oxidoreductase [Nocardia sp. NPDC003693]